MNEGVAEKHSLPDDLLDTLSLEPWFSHSVIDGAVSSKEGVEHTKLVELYV